MASASDSPISGNRDVDEGAGVGEGCVPVDGASLPEPQAVASMSEAVSAIHPRIPQKDTEDSPTVVFVAGGPGRRFLRAIRLVRGSADDET
jgi:hypothetical protein